MKNEIMLMVAAFALLVGCNQHPATPATNVVSEREFSAFLQQAKTEDFHDVARAGEALLKPGLVIPDYRTRLKGFPSAIPKGGQVRYEIMSFRGNGGAGGINLFLDADSGEIIRFLPFEATF